MSNNETNKPAKTKKYEQAFAIYEKHLSKKDTMKKREFRAMVVAEMSEVLGVTNKGTLGMYYAWADQKITGRKAAVYSRGDGARAKKGTVVSEETSANLNRAANQFGAVVLSKAARKADGFGTPSI